MVARHCDLLLDKADVRRSAALAYGDGVERMQILELLKTLKVGYVAWPIDDCAERLDLRVEALETIAATIVEASCAGRRRAAVEVAIERGFGCERKMPLTSPSSRRCARVG